MRQPGGEGRPVIELVALLPLVALEGFLKRLVLFPDLEDRLLHFGKRHLIGNCLEHFVACANGLVGIVFLT